MDGAEADCAVNSASFDFSPSRSLDINEKDRQMGQKSRWEYSDFDGRNVSIFRRRSYDKELENKAARGYTITRGVRSLRNQREGEIWTKDEGIH